MDSLSDVFRLCRLCLVQERVNIPIFDDPDNVRQIPLKISSCLPVQVSREDNLPKKICDECSNKLDLCYDFWTSTANAEKTLLSTVEKQNQAPEPAAFQLFKTEPEDVAVPEETQSQIPEPQVPEPILIKAESEEIEAPPAKRPRQSAAIKAQMHMAPESDDDEVTADQDFNGAEDEVEEEIDDPDVPDMSVDIDEVKPGTSGLNLEIADAKAQTKETKKHSCEQCDKSFKGSTGLKEHVATIHTKEYRYHCEYCDRGFYRDSRKRAHIKRSHEKVPAVRDYAKFQCPKCGKCLANKQSYELHQDVVHNRVDRFYCEQCGKGFPLRGYLVQHQKVNHFEVDAKPFACPHPKCTKTFRTKDLCRTHQLIHETDRKFECLECSKVYVHVMSFKKHLREHKRGKKVFKCELCDKMVSSRTSLRDHIRTHTGEKPFECPHCVKTFVNKKHLNVHIVVHTKEKRYECRVCGKKYTQRSSLRGHFLKNHPEDDL